MASASSYYHLIDGVNDYVYYPEYTTGNNNGTMWRAGTNDLPQHLTLDLGGETTVRRVMTQFEYATYTAPLSLSWNSAFTISAWVYNKKISNAETIVVWSKRTDNLMGEYAAFMVGTNEAYGAAAHWGRLDMAYNTVPEEDKWHHFALTFDGMVEKIYVDKLKSLIRCYFIRVKNILSSRISL